MPTHPFFLLTFQQCPFKWKVVGEKMLNIVFIEEKNKKEN
jgi:hypothetical protein